MLRLVPMLKPIPRHLTWLNDKHHMRFSEQRHKSHDVASQSRWVNLGVTSNRFSIFEIIDADGHSIGSLTGYLDDYNITIDMGILIGPCFTKVGNGLEAWKLGMRHFFNEGAEKIEAGCRSDHESMLSIFQKSGMLWEGERREHFLDDEGNRIGLMQYGITRPEWEEWEDQG
jgi:RimJ/RimL family protein N-acetyltransferase